MAQWQVYWSNDRGAPRASHWYEWGGVITYASGQLKQWEGRRHGDLVASLGRGSPPRYVHQLSTHCVPPTKKYHRQLKANVDQLLKLLEADDGTTQS